jgi:serine protease inhibitor
MKTIFSFLSIAVLLACNRQTQSSGQENQSTIIATYMISDPDSAMIKSNNTFAFELFPYVKSDQQNSFFSPYSISAALAMTYAGARGESEKQISKVLHFDSNQTKFHPSYKALLGYISSLNKADTLTLLCANSMWAQKNYPFSDSYFKLVSKFYDAGLQNLDFKADAEGSRKIINNWVEEKTKSKIQNLLIPGILSDLTRLVLVNAIYFYGSWDKAFDEKETSKAQFYIEGKNNVQADLMHMLFRFRYLDDGDKKIIEIPYLGKTVSMLVILPKENKNLNSIEKSLNLDNYSLWLSMMTEQKIHLYLPKFKVTSEFELSDALKKMGMPHPFSKEADFSGMTGHMDLMIDKIVHKAFVEVNERGTEAAASTAVIMREKSGMVDIPEFRADHPFIFIIKENKYNSILFMGEINDPTK